MTCNNVLFIQYLFFAGKVALLIKKRAFFFLSSYADEHNYYIASR